MLWLVAGSSFTDEGFLYVIEASTEVEAYEAVAKLRKMSYKRVDNGNPKAVHASVKDRLDDEDEFGGQDFYDVLVSSYDVQVGGQPSFKEIDDGEVGHFSGFFLTASTMRVGENLANLVQW